MNLNRRTLMKASSGIVAGAAANYASAKSSFIPSVLSLLLEDNKDTHVKGAKTVNPSNGNDGNDGVLSADGGTGSWKTLEFALQNMNPGETLELMFNYYQVAAINSALKIDTDASAAPIVVTRHPDFKPKIDCALVTTPHVYSCDGMTNWRWSDIDFHRCLTVFDVGENTFSTDNQFRNIRALFKSNTQNFSNVSLVRLSASSSCMGCDRTVVDRCSGAVYPGEFNSGAHVFQCFRSHSYQVSNIYGKDIGQVVYHKHSVDNVNANLSKSIFIKNVLAENCISAVEWRGANGVIQDVIGAGCPAIAITSTISNGPDVAANTDFLHVTSTTDGISIQGMETPKVNPVANTRFLNNVFSDVFRVYDEYPVTAGNITDYNLYIDRYNAIYYGHGGTDYTLSGWQTFRGQDANSIAGQAQFVDVDEQGIALTIGGYALQEGSLGVDSASDGGDLGARISNFDLLSF